jgi:hypothetical protein
MLEVKAKLDAGRAKRVAARAAAEAEALAAAGRPKSSGGGGDGGCGGGGGAATPAASDPADAGGDRIDPASVSFEEYVRSMRPPPPP